MQSFSSSGLSRLFRFSPFPVIFSALWWISCESKGIECVICERSSEKYSKAEEDTVLTGLLRNGPFDQLASTRQASISSNHRSYGVSAECARFRGTLSHWGCEP
jgi:hypothetical protein